MQFKETEIQEYIWNHRDKLFFMIQTPVFEKDPNKKPWEYEPFELLYYQILKEYEEYYKSLARLEFFGCEVRLPKDGENTIRSDFFGSFEGENGFVICELKVNKQPERQSFTELFAYANHVRSKFAPMGRRDIFYLLISPMEERIVREATISNLVYDKNRIVALIPKVENDLDSLRFELWVPSKNEFRLFTKATFTPENIDVFRISWSGAEGVWSPTKKGKEPNAEMIHRLNKVSHYAAQLMEANGINGFVFCLQSYPEERERGFFENGFTICGINPFKSAKTRYLYENGASLEDAAKADMEAVGIGDFFPGLEKDDFDSDVEDPLYWLAFNWSSCIDEIALDVVQRLNRTVGPATYHHGYGGFDWQSYRYNSHEDELCWNYDISLTGIFREIYYLYLERVYRAGDTNIEEERIEMIDSGKIEWHIIDMMYSHDHIREFVDGLIK